MQNSNSPLGTVKDEAQRISQSARGWIIPLARFGYAAKGVVYLIIGGLAALAAFTGGGRNDLLSSVGESISISNCRSPKI